MKICRRHCQQQQQQQQQQKITFGHTPRNIDLHIPGPDCACQIPRLGFVILSCYTKDNKLRHQHNEIHKTMIVIVIMDLTQLIRNTNPPHPPKKNNNNNNNNNQKKINK